MKKEEPMLYYEVLTEDEIVLFTQTIDRFRDGEIDYQGLVDEFLGYGVSIEPVLVQSQPKMTIAQGEAYDKRMAEKRYMPNDISFLRLSSKDYKDVLFKKEYKVIELMASRGFPRYQQAMIMVLKTQLRYSYDNSEKMRCERAMWRRRIAELENKLESTKKAENVNGL